MAELRQAGQDWSPREGVGIVNMDACQSCPYFRGASLGPGRKDWNVICNWPNNGGVIDPMPASTKPEPSCEGIHPHYMHGGVVHWYDGDKPLPGPPE